MGDKSADMLGSVFRGFGYGIGRASPAIEDAAKAMAQTKAGQFVCENFAEGYRNGVDATLKSRAETIARKEMMDRIRKAKEEQKRQTKTRKDVEEFVETMNEDVSEAVDFIRALMERLARGKEKEG